MHTIFSAAMMGMVIGAVLLCGCTDQGPAEPVPSAPLNGTAWTLTAYDAGNGTSVSPIEGTEISAVFGDDGRISGSSGCNRYSGTYTANGGTLAVGPLAVTLMACGEPAGVMDQESAYLGALGSATGFAITDGRLEISGENGRVLLEFVEAAPLPVTNGLAGTAWTLVSYRGTEGSPAAVIDGTEVTALFSEDGRITGSAGCNDYFASYETENGRIRIGSAGATKMYCGEPAGVMDQEGAYLAALEEASFYSVNETGLVISDDAGLTLLVFIPASSVASELAGTSWRLTGLQTAGGAMAAPLEGAPVTLAFGTDGTLGGSSGCNQYSASCEVTDGGIRVGALAVTERYCIAPEGVMEQESAYLALLRSARGYRLEEGRLILTGDGNEILEFAAA